jgi:hypothetical protein
MMAQASFPFGLAALSTFPVASIHSIRSTSGSLLIAGADDPVEIERKLKGLMREALVDLAETEIEVLEDDIESV